MLTKVSFAILLIMWSFSVNAQKPFKPRPSEHPIYLVSNQGDTILRYVVVPYIIKNNTGYLKCLNDIKVIDTLRNSKKCTADEYSKFWIEYEGENYVYESVEGLGTEKDGEKRAGFCKMLEAGYLKLYIVRHTVVRVGVAGSSSGMIAPVPMPGSEYHYLVRVGNSSEFIIMVYTSGGGAFRKAIANYIDDCSELREKIESKEILKPTEIISYYNVWHQKIYGE